MIAFNGHHLTIGEVWQIARGQSPCALADDAPGFVWRLKDDDGAATAIRPFGNDFIVNMSVWNDVSSLSDYAFRSGHVDIMRRRREWFEQMVEAYAVLWWVPKDHHPSTEEARERLAHLQTFGATPYAFTFKDAFSAPDTGTSVNVANSSDGCPAA